MTDGISRTPAARASRRARPLLLLAVCATACGGRAPAKVEPATEVSRTVPLADLLVLETTGAPPHDTSVTIAAGRPRVILLPHAPPDDVLFAELAFPPDAFDVPPGTEVTVSVRPRPGVYGLDVESTAPFRAGGTVTFKYPVHFLAPLAARARFANDRVYERALAVGRLMSGDNVLLLASTRPASDNLRSPLPAPGSYLVGAPK